MTERTEMAREAAIAEYLAMGVELDELGGSGIDTLAAAARYWRETPVRAAAAERDDPEPPIPSWCPCPVCQGYLLQVRWEQLMGRRSTL